ncbi:MAG: LolA family protein [Actinomycetota bacterium]
MARILRKRSILASAAAAVVIVMTIALTTAGAAPRPDLAPVPADTLIASSLAAVADPSLSMSGTVSTHVDLGIPQLPGTLSSSSGPLSVLLSDQTFKVWRSPDGKRIAQILPSAERDVIATPTDVWAWDSQQFTAWHATVPSSTTARQSPSPADIDTIVSKAITTVAPYADVTTAAPIEVAGRPAYVVRLTPASSSNTLVDRIDVAIDAETRVPLRFQIFAKGVADAVVDVTYTDVSFGAVDPSVFSFTPPSGATVHQLVAPTDAETGSPADSPMAGIRMFGTGFDLVAAVPVPSVPKQLEPFFPYRGPLGSADVVERGGQTWIVAGLVPPDALAKAEQKLP